MAKTYGFGTEIQMGDGASSEVFTAIAYVSDIGGGGLSQEFADITSHDSPGRVREFMPTLLTLEDVPIEIVWDPANGTHSALLDAHLAGTMDNYKIVFPTSPAVTWAFPAYVASFNYTAKTDDALRASVVLKPTGEPTIT